MSTVPTEGLESIVEAVKARYHYRLYLNTLREDGGPGSGNWGHAGRKGVRGGSAPGSRKKANPEPKDRPGEFESPTGMFNRNSGDTGRRGYSGGSRIQLRSLREGLDRYKAGLDPFTVSRVHCDSVSARMFDGGTVIGTNGKTYVSVNGRWVEKGNETSEPDDLPVSRGAAPGDRDHIEGYVTGDFYTLTLRLQGVSREETGKFAETMRSCPKALRDRYTETIANTPIKLDVPIEKSQHYATEDRSLHLYPNPYDDDLLHELAHAMDDERGGKGVLRKGSISKKLDRQLSKAMRDLDVQTICEAAGVSMENYGKPTWPPPTGADAYAAYMTARLGRLESGDEVGDILCSATKGAFFTQFPCGHSRRYYTEPIYAGMGSHQSAEQWANFAVIKARNDAESLRVLEQLVPETYKMLEMMYREEFEDGQ